MFLVMGSVNADLVSFTERFPKIGETIKGRTFHVYQGGKGANQAVGIAKLKENVTFLGRVGKDFFGDFLIRSLKEEGVDVSNVKKKGGSSGVAAIWVNDQGENSIILNSGANETLDAQEIRASSHLFGKYSYLLVQLETPLSGVIEACKLAKENEMTVILDPAPAVKLPVELLKNVDYLTPNEVEINVISSGNSLLERVKELEKSGPRVIVKAGEKGVYLSYGTDLKRLKAFKIEARDTTGAGDCFNAAFAVAISKGKGIEEACTFAMAAAALSVNKEGAARSFPVLTDVEEFLKRS